MKLEHWFSLAAGKISRATGHSTAFVAAVAIVVVWGVTGPIFGYSDTWQLVINTGTTIVTFLMVFLIQNSQNRDTAAIQVKLDELIRATKGAKNAVMDLEDQDDKLVEQTHQTYRKLAHSCGKEPAKARPARRRKNRRSKAG